MSDTMSGTMSKPESVVGGQTPQLTTPLAAQQIHSSAAVQRENEVGIPHEAPSPSLASSLQPQPGAEGCSYPPTPPAPQLGTRPQRAWKQNVKYSPDEWDLGPVTNDHPTPSHDLLKDMIYFLASRLGYNRSLSLKPDVWRLRRGEGDKRYLSSLLFQSSGRHFLWRIQGSPAPKGEGEENSAVSAVICLENSAVSAVIYSYILCFYILCFYFLSYGIRQTKCLVIFCD